MLQDLFYAICIYLKYTTTVLLTETQNTKDASRDGNFTGKKKNAWCAVTMSFSDFLSTTPYSTS